MDIRTFAICEFHRCKRGCSNKFSKYQRALLKYFPYTFLQVCNAAVAQLVEQRIRNAKVVSSIPTSGTSNTKVCSDVSLFILCWISAHLSTV